MLVGCPTNFADPEKHWLYWQKIVQSASYQDELRAVHNVHDYAVRLDFPVLTWTWPASV